MSELLDHPSNAGVLKAENVLTNHFTVLSKILLAPSMLPCGCSVVVEFTPLAIGFIPGKCVFKNKSRIALMRHHPL